MDPFRARTHTALHRSVHLSSRISFRVVSLAFVVVDQVRICNCSDRNQLCSSDIADPPSAIHYYHDCIQMLPCNHSDASALPNLAFARTKLTLPSSVVNSSLNRSRIEVVTQMRIELDLLSLVVKVSRVVLLDLLHWIFASLAAGGVPRRREAARSVRARRRLALHAARR